MFMQDIQKYYYTQQIFLHSDISFIYLFIIDIFIKCLKIHTHFIKPYNGNFNKFKFKFIIKYSYF